MEAAQVTVRSDREWHSQLFHPAMRRGRKIAKVAISPQTSCSDVLDVAQGMNYEQLKQFGSDAVSIPWSAAVACASAPSLRNRARRL